MALTPLSMERLLQRIHMRAEWARQNTAPQSGETCHPWMHALLPRHNPGPLHASASDCAERVSNTADVPLHAQHRERLFIVKESWIWFVGWLDVSYTGRFLCKAGEEVPLDLVGLFQFKDALETVQRSATVQLPSELGRIREFLTRDLDKFLESIGAGTGTVCTLKKALATVRMPHPVIVTTKAQAWVKTRSGFVHLRNMIKRWAPGHSSHGEVLTVHGSPADAYEGTEHGHLGKMVPVVSMSRAGQDKGTGTPFFDVDVLALIQAALPFKSFHRSMIVCKAWHRNVVASSTSFREHRLRLAPTEHFVLEMLSKNSNKDMSAGLPRLASAYQMGPGKRDRAREGCWEGDLTPAYTIFGVVSADNRLGHEWAGTWMDKEEHSGLWFRLPHGAHDKLDWRMVAQAGGLICYRTCDRMWDGMPRLYVYDPVLNTALEVRPYPITTSTTDADTFSGSRRWACGHVQSAVRVISLQAEPTSRRCDFKITALVRKPRPRSTSSMRKEFEEADSCSRLSRNRFRVPKADYITTVYDSRTGTWTDVPMATTLAHTGMESFGTAAVVDGWMFVLEKSWRPFSLDAIDLQCRWNQGGMCPVCRKFRNRPTYRLVGLDMANPSAGWSYLWQEAGVSHGLEASKHLKEVCLDLLADQEGRLLLLGTPYTGFHRDHPEVTWPKRVYHLRASSEKCSFQLQRTSGTSIAIVWQILPVTFDVQPFAFLDRGKVALPEPWWELVPRAWFCAQGKVYISFAGVKQLLVMECNADGSGPPEFFWMPPSPILLEEHLSIGSDDSNAGLVYQAIPICPRTDAFIPKSHRLV